MDPLGNNGVVHYVLIQLFFETGENFDEARQHKRKKKDKALNAKITQEERNEKKRRIVKHIILKKQQLRSVQVHFMLFS